MALKACIECKKEISTAADPCPHCGKKHPHGTSNVVKYGGGFLMVVIGLPVFIGMINGLSSGGSPPDTAGTSIASAEAEPAPTVEAPQQRQEGPATPVDAMKLWKDYDANEVAADAVYKGKSLLVTGTVAGIEKDFLDHAIVEFASPNQFMSTRATLHDSQKGRAATLKKGQVVTMLCVGAGKTISIPGLDDCRFAQ